MKWLLAALLLSLAGCSTTGQTIQNLDRPVRQLQRIADKNLPTGRRSVSRNGRVFISKYFAIDKGKWIEHTDEKLRYYAEIKVLGNGRPYSMEIAIFSQKVYGEKSFSKPQYSEGLTRVLVRRIDKTIHKAGLDINVIDDFRVF